MIKNVALASLVAASAVMAQQQADPNQLHIDTPVSTRAVNNRGPHRLRFQTSAQPFLRATFLWVANAL